MLFPRTVCGRRLGRLASRRRRARARLSPGRAGAGRVRGLRAPGPPFCQARPAATPVRPASVVRPRRRRPPASPVRPPARPVASPSGRAPTPSGRQPRRPASTVRPVSPDNRPDNGFAGRIRASGRTRGTIVHQILPGTLILPGLFRTPVPVGQARSLGLAGLPAAASDPGHRGRVRPAGPAEHGFGVFSGRLVSSALCVTPFAGALADGGQPGSASTTGPRARPGAR